MPLIAEPLQQSTGVGFYRDMQNDEATTASSYYSELMKELRRTSLGSEFWQSKIKFDTLRQKLHSTASLSEGWNTYGSEPPNEAARKLASAILQGLEKESMAPSSLLPSGEGGITISFVRGMKRAMLETYNTGEVVGAKYSASDEPEVWEFELTESRLQDAIEQIRVYLAA
jgi:hypothetical protein